MTILKEKTSSIPYANATSGMAAREEIIRILRRFGRESVGFMDDFAEHAVILAFTHRGPACPAQGLGERLGANVFAGEPMVRQQEER
jgi:hypothetical protein